MDFNQLIGTDVEFTSEIDTYEAYTEPKMRGTITKIIPDGDLTREPEEQLWTVVIDYSKFDSYNAKLESSNYYGSGKNGQSTKPEYTAREVGLYKEVETLYFPAPNYKGGKDWSIYFSKLASAKTALVDRYNQADTDMSYVEWLESQLV